MALISDIIKSIPTDTYGKSHYKILRDLSEEQKVSIATNHLFRCKLLNSQYPFYRLEVLNIFVEYIKELSCTDFIDLLWIIGDGDSTTYRAACSQDRLETITKVIDLLKNKVKADSTNYFVLLNMLKSELNGHYYVNNIKNARKLFCSLIDIMRQNNLVISDKFIMWANCCVDNMFPDFVLMCIEYNKFYNKKPNNKFLRLLSFQTNVRYYDENFIKNLLDNFDDVDLSDAKPMLENCYKEETCKLLIKYIKFNQQKLLANKFKNIIERVSDLEERIKSSENKRFNKKRSRIENDTCNNESNKAVKNDQNNLVTMFEDLEHEHNHIHKTIPFDNKGLESEIIEKDVDEFDKFESDVISIQIDGMKIKSTTNKKKIWRDQFFEFCYVKDIVINVPNDGYAYYESIIRKGRFFKVFSDLTKIFITIWDLDESNEPRYFIIPKWS